MTLTLENPIKKKNYTTNEKFAIAYKISNVGMIPEDWETKKLSEISNVCSNFSVFADKIGLEYLDQMPVYIGNLSRLQLIEVPELFQYTSPGFYQDLENAPQVIKLKDQIELNPDLKCVLQRKGVKITDLGKQFIRICVTRSNS